MHKDIKKVYINKDEIIKIKAIEGDLNTRFIVFQFISGNKPINLAGRNVRASGETSEAYNNQIFNDLTVIDEAKGLAKLELTSKFLIKGVTKYQLHIFESGGGHLSSNIFELEVGKSLLDAEAYESTNEFKAFENALGKIDKYDTRLRAVEFKTPQIDDNKTNISNLKNDLNTTNKTVQIINTELEKAKGSLKDAESNITKINTTIKKENIRINNLENVKGIPYSDLVCFIPTKTRRFFQTFELIPEKNEIIAGYRNVNETVENKVAELQKFDYISKESKSHKEVDLLYHINDIAYLPTTNELLVATMDPENPYKLVVLDYDTLNFKRYQEIPNLSNTISGVAYNKDSGKIIIKTGGSNNLKILSKDYNIEKEIAVTQEETFQAIASSKNYVYFVMNNILKVINIDTEETIVYSLNGAGENEGCSIDINGNVWLGYVMPGDNYRYDTPRLFECDLTQKSYHGTLNERHVYWQQEAKNNMVECGQFFYVKKEGGQWKVSNNESHLGIYSRAGNNFMELKVVENHLEIHTRVGLLYKLHGGVHLDRFVNINKAGLKAGLQCSLTYSMDEGIRVDFVDVTNKTDVLPGNVADDIGFTVGYKMAIQGL